MSPRFCIMYFMTNFLYFEYKQSSESRHRIIGNERLQVFPSILDDTLLFTDELFENDSN